MFDIFRNANMFDKKKDQDSTQLIQTFEVTELVGIVSLLYGMLLHSGAPSRGDVAPPELSQHTLLVTLTGLRMLNNMAMLDLGMLQVNHWAISCSRCNGSSDRSIMGWTHWAISHSSLVLHDWCNKGSGMCYPVCGMVHIKEPLLLIGKSSMCGGSGYPFSLTEWYLTICLTPYNRKYNVLSASLNKHFIPSFLACR